jgi:hypothetical protein
MLALASRLEYFVCKGARAPPRFLLSTRNQWVSPLIRCEIKSMSRGTILANSWARLHTIRRPIGRKPLRPRLASSQIDTTFQAVTWIIWL